MMTRQFTTHLLSSFVLSTVMMACAGCQCTPKPAPSDRTENDEVTSAVITDAFFTGTGPIGPNSRTEITLNGSYFKTGNVSVEDCMTRLPDHPVPSQREWKNCREVYSASGIMWHVDAEHSAANNKVEVRVRGAGGNWSNHFLVRKD